MLYIYKKKNDVMAIVVVSRFINNSSNNSKFLLN